MLSSQQNFSLNVSMRHLLEPSDHLQVYFIILHAFDRSGTLGSSVSHKIGNPFQSLAAVASGRWLSDHYKSSELLGIIITVLHAWRFFHGVDSLYNYYQGPNSIRSFNAYNE